jgi:hypothetical protein
MKMNQIKNIKINDREFIININPENGINATPMVEIEMIHRGKNPVKSIDLDELIRDRSLFDHLTVLKFVVDRDLRLPTIDESRMPSMVCQLVRCNNAETAEMQLPPQIEFATDQKGRRRKPIQCKHCHGYFRPDGAGQSLCPQCK